MTEPQVYEIIFRGSRHYRDNWADVLKVIETIGHEKLLGIREI